MLGTPATRKRPMQRLVTRVHTWERGLLWPLAGEYKLTADTVEGAMTPLAVRYWAVWE